MPEKIDYIIHEGVMVRQERTIKRLWVMALALLALTVLTNTGWVVWVLSTR